MPPIKRNYRIIFIANIIFDAFVASERRIISDRSINDDDERTRNKINRFEITECFGFFCV